MSDDAEKEGPKRPTPIRESVPPRPTPVRGADAAAGDAETGAEGEGKPAAPRPTPVREAMDVRREEPEDVDPPSVPVYRDDEVWIARVEGRVRAGFRGDDGVPLLHLTFARDEEPEVRLKEVYGVGRRLDELNQAELLDLLDRARAVPESWERSPLFPETRKGRKGR